MQIGITNWPKFVSIVENDPPDDGAYSNAKSHAVTDSNFVVAFRTIIKDKFLEYGDTCYDVIPNCGMRNAKCEMVEVLKLLG